ncbi:MAG: M48 family metallopeptidase [Sulfitobacter sp.]
MKFIKKLNERLGENIRDNVVREIANVQFSGANKVNITARIIAILIVATPYVIAAAGAAAIAFGFPDILPLVFGALLLCVAAYLRPRKNRNQDTTLTVQEAPVLLGLLNDIAGQLGAPRINGVHVLGGFNAYMAEFGGQERVVGIGAPLWLALDHDERIALLAHEVAHLANNDPARMQLTGTALQTLGRWLQLFSPPSIIDHESNVEIVVDDRGILAQVIGAVFGAAFGALTLAYEKLIFANSQRAEYLADVMATSVAGTSAMQSTLKKLILAPLAEKVMATVYYDGSQEVHLFDNMAEVVRSPDIRDSDRLFKLAIEELHSVDASHPPTRFRLEVVGVAEQGDVKMCADNIDWIAIEDELSASVEAEERKILNSMINQ